MKPSAGWRWTIRVAVTAVLGIGTSFAGAAATNSSSGLEVRAVKFWSLGTSTRVAIEVSDDFRFRKEHLANPERMFYDIAGAQPRIEGPRSQGQHIIPVNDRFVKQIRVAEPQRGTTRVVLDLESGVECNASQLSDPHQLVIEVTAPGRPETPTVTPSVVQIKRFEAPPATNSVAAKPAVERKISVLDDPAPQVTAKNPAATNVLPTAKTRKLLAAAIVPDPPPPPPAANAEPEMAAAPEPRLSRATNGSKPPLIEEGAPLPARPPATANPSLTRVFGLKIKRVIIDAGHGGKDQGTHGPAGLLEKDLVLDVARRVGAMVEERLGVEVVYTRADDTFIPLEQRTKFANDQKGDLFISIHANSSPVKAVSGVEIYVLNLSTSKVDLDLAARENAGAESSVSELETLLQKAMLNDKLKESSEFAGKVLQSMTGPGAPGAAAGKARSRGVRRAPFVVLIGANMPSILCEIGFISNPADEALMAKSAYRQKIAESLTKGIQDFAQSLSRYQVASKPAAPKQVTSGR